jgi:hypothetical protein
MFETAVVHIFSLCCLLMIVSVGNTDAEEAPHLFATGEILEVDRCASAWLIKRFVDKEAVFVFYSTNDLITEGTPFDRPEGKLQRTHSKSTFEVIMQAYGITTPELQHIGQLIHDLEINFWGKKDNPESLQLAAEVRKQFQGKSPELGLKACFSYFDQLHTVKITP